MMHSTILYERHQNINFNFKYVVITYLYDEQGDNDQKPKSKDIVGYKSCSKIICKDLKLAGKVIGWTQEQMYIRNDLV